MARGETTLAKSSLVGFILCNALWVFGTSLYGVGYRHKEFLVTSILYTMTGLCLVASALASILVWFDIMIGEVPPSPDKTTFLSRSIAIASLLLWASFLAFRNHTHAHLNGRGYSDDIELSVDRSLDNAASLSPIENLIQASIRLVLLGICADNIVHGLLLQPILTRSICTYFVIPLTARVWAQYRGVRSARPDMDFFEEAVDSSIGAALNTLLCVGPCLVLLGGIIGSPMNLRFSIMEITLVDVAIWTLSVSSAAEFIFNYLSVALMMSLYVMSALGLYLTL